MIFIKILISGIFIFGGFLIYRNAQRTLKTRKVLDENPTGQAQATIISAGFRHIGVGRAYFTAYSYTVGDAVYDSEETGNLEPLIEDGFLPIRYLEAEPSVHEVVGLNQAMGFQVIFARVIALAFVIAGIAFFLFFEF